MRIILVFVIVCLPVFSYSQFIVEDPALATLVTTLNSKSSLYQVKNQAEFVAQTSTLKETLTFMKETRDKLKKVNALLSQVIYYKDLIKTQLTIIDYQIDYISDIKDDDKIKPEELKAINDMFGDMLRRSEGLLKLAGELLRDEKYEMSDADRLENLKKINDEMSSIFSEMVGVTQKYDYLRKERQMIQILDKW